MLLTSMELSAAPETVRLWNGDAPRAKGSNKGDIPTLTIYPVDAAKRGGTAVIVLPGGGYARLADDHEGRQIAEWFNSKGVSAFVLKYRHGPKYGHPAPLLDVQRAIRYVRHHASKWGVSPVRLGLYGSSAGGHLASTAGTRFDKGNPEASDAIDKQSSRPDFLVLAYPVISLTHYVHEGSRCNLLGPAFDMGMAKSLSSDTQVTPETPPTFLFHTDEDPGVPAENSVLFYLALRKHKVPAEIHIYEKGPHGVGLAQTDPVLSTWSARLHDWLKVRGLLDPPGSR